MKIKVNIVDDHKVVTDGLRVILDGSDDMEVLNVANSGELALAQLRQESRPDVLLLDYSLKNPEGKPQMNGLETAEKVLSDYPTVRILMLTMHHDPEIIVPCVSAGVQGYMLKSEKDGDIGEAIRRLHLNGHYFSPEVARYLAVHTSKFDTEELAVSNREQEVLELLFQGMTTREIADELYLSHHTVESHRKNLINKFEARNSVHLIYLALKKGYLKV
jgi:DNA-binding NarL/FixJ family response regulator